MRTPKQLYLQISGMYTYEQETCAICGCRLEQRDYASGRKIVQTMTSVMKIAYYPKRCPNPECEGEGIHLRSAQWQQIAPLYSTYGHDVIANIEVPAKKWTSPCRQQVRRLPGGSLIRKLTPEPAKVAVNTVAKAAVKATAVKSN